MVRDTASSRRANTTAVEATPRTCANRTGIARSCNSATARARTTIADFMNDQHTNPSHICTPVPSSFIKPTRQLDRRLNMPSGGGYRPLDRFRPPPPKLRQCRISVARKTAPDLLGENFLYCY